MKPILFYLKNSNYIAKRLLILFSNILSDDLYLKILYHLHFHKPLNLQNPQTFSEKLQWLKLYNRDPRYTQMVDKVRVKEYVKNIIGEKYIIPTLGVWNSFDEIDFKLLPNSFVLKTSGGGGSTGVIICTDKKDLNLAEARKCLEKSLHNNIYNTYKEWPYKDVQPKIIAEKLLETPNGGDLMDYKFVCFNGNPHYCQVISGRKTTMSIDFFDKNWKHQDFHEPKDFPFAKIEPTKPINYDLMWNLAEKLSKNIPFVRIDFYNVNGQIYFGEITFFPTSGLGGFDPQEWDLKFGQLIKLPLKCKKH